MHRIAVILMACAIAWVYAKTTVLVDYSGQEIGVIVTWHADDTEGLCHRQDGQVPWLEMEKTIMLTTDGATPIDVSPHSCVWSRLGRGP
jgi:hypothetical protein